MESLWVDVDGLQMHTRVSMTATPVDRVPIVLVHGLGVSGTYWLPTAELLSEHFCVFVPDLPGFGRSQNPSGVPDLRELAGMLIAWMDAMKLELAALVGNSMGCQIAVNATLAHPHRVTRLVMQGPTIDPDARSAYSQLSRLLVDGLVEPPSLLPVVMRDYLKCGYRRIAGTLRHSLNDPIEENLPRVRAAALVIRGARDPIVPQRWAEDAARLLPLGRLIVMPGAAHAINFSHPVELARIIRRFLTAEDDEAAARGKGTREPSSTSDS